MNFSPVAEFVAGRAKRDDLATVLKELVDEYNCRVAAEDDSFALKTGGERVCRPCRVSSAC